MLLNLKIYLTFSGGGWGKRRGRREAILLASTYCLYRCSKNWYLVGSTVSEEEADERRAGMHGESIWRKEGNKWKKLEVRKGGHVKSKISKNFVSGKLNVPKGDILSQLLLHNRSIKPSSFAPRLPSSHYRRILGSINSAQELWTEKTAIKICISKEYKAEEPSSILNLFLPSISSLWLMYFKKWDTVLSCLQQNFFFFNSFHCQLHPTVSSYTWIL